MFSKPNKLITQDFIVLYRLNNNNLSRLGFALAKKKIKRACDRNRIKRLLRETFRIRKLPTIDIIFLARNNVASHNNKKIILKLNMIWDKLENYQAS